MNTHTLELSDPDRDAVTIHHDDSGIWVTCTSQAEEVTVGPLPLAALRDWLVSAQSAGAQGRQNDPDPAVRPDQRRGAVPRERRLRARLRTRPGPAGVASASGVTGAPVTIGTGSWIAAGAIILPGVAIVHSCVVAAGAIVTRATEPDGPYVGSPVRRVRDVDGTVLG